MTQLSLPAHLEAYRTEIEATMVPTIKATATSQETTLWDSKVGGVPYFPKDMPYPKNTKGTPMRLLAQLNLSELPSTFSELPNEGILQFFLQQDEDDDLYGADYDNLTNQEGFKVIYHEKVVEDESHLLTDFSFVEGLVDELLLPIEPDTEAKLTFSEKQEPVSFCDFRFDNLLGNVIPEFITVDGQEHDLIEEYAEHFDSSGHKIGGYACFTQADPRDEDTSQAFLLFQLDSDTKIDCIWGDMGVGNFFISPEDLRNRNFSNVLYTWDCG